jgi:hypothetical protein
MGSPLAAECDAPMLMLMLMLHSWYSFERSNGCSMMLNQWLVQAVCHALRAKRSVKTLQNSPAPIWTSMSCHMLMGANAR